MKVKFKILLPIIIILFLLLGMGIFSIYYIQKNAYENDIKERVAGTERLFQHSLKEESKILASHVNFLLKDSVILKLYKNKNQEELYKYCLPILQNIKPKNNITHFYFIDTTETCFLRIHNKFKFNDTIRRFTFLETKQTKKPTHGIELGTFNTFTLRYVSPININNKTVGYI